MSTPGPKRQERRVKTYTALVIEAKMLGGGKNLHVPQQPNSNQIKNLREYIEVLRRKL